VINTKLPLILHRFSRFCRAH